MTKILKTTDKNVTQITNLDNRFYFIARDALNGVPKAWVKDWWIEQIKAHGGIYLPSVTWILEKYPKDEFFYKWLANQPGEDAAQRLKERGGDRGTKVHHAIEKLILGKKIERDDRYFSELTETEERLKTDEWRALVAFADWWKKHRPAVISIEKTVYSLRQGYAGTVDFIGVIQETCGERNCPCVDMKGKIALIDWKTGKAVYPAYKAQVAAYVQANEERKGPKVECAAVLLLGTKHKNKYLFEQASNLDDSFAAFSAVKVLFDGVPHVTEPEIDEVPASLQLEIVWRSIEPKNGKETSVMPLKEYLLVSPDGIIQKKRRKKLVIPPKERMAGKKDGIIQKKAKNE